MRVIFVGANPSFKTGSDPKKTPSIKRLFKWCQIINLNLFSFTNASLKYTVGNKQPTLTGDCLELLADQVNGYDKVIALGQFASDALNKICVDHLEMPHPSPLNRKLNDKCYEYLCLMGLKNYIGCDRIEIQDRRTNQENNQ